MAATNATFKFIGKSGKTYTVDAYVPDATGTNITFNPTGLAGATSTAYWKAPEACMLSDIIAVGAPTAVGAILTLSGALYAGQTVRWNNQLASLPNRLDLQIPIPAGEQVGALQF